VACSVPLSVSIVNVGKIRILTFTFQTIRGEFFSATSLANTCRSMQKLNFYDL